MWKFSKKYDTLQELRSHGKHNYSMKNLLDGGVRAEKQFYLTYFFFV